MVDEVKRFVAKVKPEHPEHPAHPEHPMKSCLMEVVTPSGRMTVDLDSVAGVEENGEGSLVYLIGVGQIEVSMPYEALIALWHDACDDDED